MATSEASSTFVVDDELGTVRYLVVDTGAFIGENRVLISPISPRNVDWRPAASSYR